MLAPILMLLATLSAPPGPTVARAGARIAGAPWAAEELVKVSFVESRHTRLGLHGGLNRAGRDFYRRALRVGWLKPCQQHSPDEWGVRGSFGLVAAYHIRHLEGCAQPAALDVPIVSAVLAARWWIELRRRGFCDYKARRAAYKHGAQSAEAKAELTRCRA